MIIQLSKHLAAKFIRLTAYTEKKQKECVTGQTVYPRFSTVKKLQNSEGISARSRLRPFALSALYEKIDNLTRLSDCNVQLICWRKLLTGMHCAHVLA